MSNEIDTTFSAKQKVFSKSLEIKDAGKSRQGKPTFILSFLCQVRAVWGSLHLPLFLAPSSLLLSASQVQWLSFSSLDALCSAVPCLENTFLPLHLTAAPHPSDLCSLTASSRKAVLISLSRSVSLSWTLLAPCGSVLKHRSQL